MDAKLRDAIWERDKGTCQKCGVEVIKCERVFSPKKEAQLQLANIKGIPIYTFSLQCNSCRKKTPVWTYFVSLFAIQDELEDTIYCVGDVRKLDEQLAEINNNIKLANITEAEKSFTNICLYCGSSQSNELVKKELINLLEKEEKRAKERYEEYMHSSVDDDPFEYVHVITPLNYHLSNNLKVEDFNVKKGRRKSNPLESLIGEIHHIDRNWQNDNPDNLQLLCKKCHNKLGKETTAPISRKLAPEEKRKIEATYLITGLPDDKWCKACFKRFRKNDSTTIYEGKKIHSRCLP
jgi:hypothetical protein